MVFGMTGLLKISCFAFTALVGNLVTATAVILASLVYGELFKCENNLATVLLFLVDPPFCLVTPIFCASSLSLLFPILSYCLVVVDHGGGLDLRLLVIVTTVLVVTLKALVGPAISVVTVTVVVLLTIGGGFGRLVYCTLIFVDVATVMGTNFGSVICSSRLSGTGTRRGGAPVAC